MVNRITRRVDRLERIRACSYPCPYCGWPHGEKTLRFIYPDQDEHVGDGIEPCLTCQRGRILTIRFVRPDRGVARDAAC